MKYDFDTIIDRTNSNCLKWDLFDVELPMWVADMDFKTAPEIIEKLQDKIAKGIYGYSVIPDSWYLAYINWWKKHYNLDLKKEELSFVNGVVPAISTLIRQLTKSDEKILIQSPVYHVFFYVIQDNEREVVENQLIYENNSYKIDFKDLEDKLKDEKTTLMILCNPHNPIGKIWDKEDLVRISELCRKHNVKIISDEIHCDLTDPDSKYTPFLSIDEDSIICVSPSKSFNLAGFQSAAIFCQNLKLKEEIDKAIKRDCIGSANLLAIDSTVTAYNKGEDWLFALRSYLYENKLFLDNFLKNEIPLFKLVPSKATYLLWIDISELTEDSDAFCEFLQNELGLLVSSGSIFGNCGNGFIRLNIACPRVLLEEGLNKLKEGVRKYN